MIVNAINNGAYKIIFEAAMAKNGGSGIPLKTINKITIYRRTALQPGYTVQNRNQILKRLISFSIQTIVFFMLFSFSYAQDASNDQTEQWINEKKAAFKEMGMEMFRPKEYFCDGNRPGCVVKKGEKLRPGTSPCLHMGNIYAGDIPSKAEAEIIKLGGKFNQEVKTEDGSIIRVFKLPGVKQDEPMPYIFIQIKNKKVISVQLTGESTYADIGFSSLKLGDSSEKVVLILCEPIKKIDVPDVQSVRWEWGTGFSIEIKDGKVYSIKINKY